MSDDELREEVDRLKQELRELREEIRGSGGREDLRSEVGRAREEIRRAREAARSSVEGAPGRAKRNRRHFYLTAAVGDYVDDVLDSVFRGISGEIERSVLIGPRGVYVGRRRSRRDEGERTPRGLDAEKSASLLGVLANEQRLRILSELSEGGKYAGELEEAVPDITSSTLSSHLKVLSGSGLVIQEATRGRYLITIPGRVALKLVGRVTRMAGEVEEGEEGSEPED